MGTASAHATVRVSDTRIITHVAGDWRLEHDTPRFEPLIDAALEANAAPATARCELAFDATALGAWDSSLLLFVQQAQGYGDSRGLTLDIGGLPTQVTELLALAAAVPERILAPPASQPTIVARAGQSAIAGYDAAVSGVTFLGEIAEALLRLGTGRARFHWRSFWVVVQANGSGALPIVTLIALLVGVIIAFLGVVVLQRFGAGYYVSYLVGYGMLREMGALMTGIIIAGRTGAGFAAELGSMKITEELDAYATLGVSAVDHLVMPRMLGLFVMMPLLVLYADAVGILGGMFVAITLVDLTPTQFVTGMLSAVELSDAALGIFKATIYGLIVGFAGCLHGLRTGSDASAVGRAATSAVVLGITLIIVANAVVDWLAALWKI